MSKETDKQLAEQLLVAAMDQTEELKAALDWALGELKPLAASVNKPGDPFWTDYNHARAALENRDPDEVAGP